MPGETRGYTPPADTKDQGAELETHACELQGRFQRMLRDHNWAELPPSYARDEREERFGQQQFNEKKEREKQLMEELDEFFRIDCGELPKIEVGEFDALKRIADDLFLYREASEYYDETLEQFSVVDGHRAMEILQGYVED